MTTRVVNKKNDSFDIYIGRGSIWGNTFVIGKDGSREYVILKYKLWLNTQPELILALKDIKGKTLGCFCKPEKCHGDILAEQADSKYIKNWFSNMIPLSSPIIYQNISYTTVENFYQAMKLPKDRTDLRSEIASLNPYKSKTSIRNKSKYQFREDWIKEESLKVMEYALRIKFSQSPYREMLMMTDDWQITEWNNWGDVFWGKDIVTRVGENHLGNILMKIRDSNVYV